MFNIKTILIISTILLSFYGNSQIEAEYLATGKNPNWDIVKVIDGEFTEVVFKMNYQNAREDIGGEGEILIVYKSDAEKFVKAIRKYAKLANEDGNQFTEIASWTLMKSEQSSDVFILDKNDIVLQLTIEEALNLASDIENNISLFER